MNNAEYIGNLSDVNIIIKILELISIVLGTFYTYIKISNKKNITIKTKAIIILNTVIISTCISILDRRTNMYYSYFLLLVSMIIIDLVLYRDNILYCLLTTIIAFSICYVLYVFSILLAFIPSMIIKSSNDYVTLCIILLIYFFILTNLYKINKLKYGFSFIKNKLKDTYINILILNIGCIIVFSYIVLRGYRDDLGIGKIGLGITILAMDMFLTIKQSFDLYYKQNILTKELEETKKELEEKKQEIDKLEKENLEFSKTSHSLAHKQKALEFKLEQLMKTHIDAENKETIKEEIEKVSKELYKEPNEVELTKTEIESIDNMFSYMQSECIKNNIKFELQVVGNIYYMINNLIYKNDLEILIADHIKDAIIAINNSDNLNRSILVRIGKIDNIYSLYIYDSGIEFTKEVLDNLGKKPITTHADTGGTGMGFMNTFDTLNKTKASLIINEIGNPCADNYTKVLIFKFDNQNEFKVNSYKNEVVV